MRALPLVLLVLVLPGCTTPDAPAHAATAGPACGLTGRGDLSVGPDCALEWLNVTLDAPAGVAYQAALPAPAFGLHRLLGDWSANATLEGNGTVEATDFGEGPVLLVNATGPIRLRATLATPPDAATLTAESYLFARWTTNPSDRGPHALRVMIMTHDDAAPPFAVRVAYDAISRACGRHAAFAGDAAPNQWTPLAGKDEATCS